MRKSGRLGLILFLILTFSKTAWAQAICPIDGHIIQPKGVKSLSVLESFAILQDGRVKPLDTFARNILIQFSGHSTFNRQPALHWLARLLLAPETTRDDKIFLINNPEILTALGVEPEKKRRYNFNQLEKGYPKLLELAQAVNGIEQKKRTPAENEILRVEENLRLYAKLSQNFSFVFPHPDFTVTNLEIIRQLKLSAEQSQYSFLDIASRADLLYQLTQSLETKSPQEWNERDKELIRLMTNLYHWPMAYADLPLTIIPAYIREEETWLSPWDAILAGFQTAEGRDEISLLGNLVVAYWNGQQIDFDIAARKFSDAIQKRANPKNQNALNRIPLELLYSKLNLFFWAKFLYGIVFLIFLISLIEEKRVLYRAACTLLILGFVGHVIAILLRIFILLRPPVSSLFETFIFVGFISVLLGILIESIHKKWLGIVIASICGFIFLLIASKFSTEGDTLKMLIAVLNSNFWLSTHVLSITTGYAGCCVAGIVGHVYILQSIFKSRDKKLLETTYRILLGTLGFGLTMTFLGTNLGGIWADQSWGRFWGWDPKENGALLIILWTSIIFHAKVGEMIGPLGVAVGSVLGIIVVMWAWFGVNLLSVGLHSYGFTSGLAWNLTIYVVCQLLFLTTTLPIAIKRLRS